MSELRWILLIAGLVLILGIFIYGRSKRRARASETERREPTFPSMPAPGGGAEPASSGPQSTVDSPPALRPEPMSLYEQSDLALATRPGAVTAESQAAPEGEKIIAIHVAARGGRRFQGPDVLSAFAAESLDFGDFEIFHRRTGDRSIFSVSSMVEPGKFDLNAMDEFSTPGLTLFMIMPGPESPVAAFTEMLSTARRLGAALDGEILDESGSSLSRQAASHLREQIIEFAHRVR